MGKLSSSNIFSLILCGCIEQSESEEPEFSFSLLSDFAYVIVCLGWVVSKDESPLLWFNAGHWPALNNGCSPCRSLTSHKGCGRLSKPRGILLMGLLCLLCCCSHLPETCISCSLIHLVGHSWLPPSSWKAWDPNLALDISLSFFALAESCY